MSSFHCGLWETEWREEGGRLTVLRYGGQDLLTTPPAAFLPPSEDYGQYETQPVYGYDDCFPTVDACTFPVQEWTVPDHGELCWLPWKVVVEPAQLLFEVKSEKLPITFRRSMGFQPSSLNWVFEITNAGGVEIPFLHIMHGLMPLREIVRVRVP